MANVKTAISLGKPMLEQVDAVAQEMKISRSRLFVIAVEEFLRRRENEHLVEAINKVYDENPPTERELAQLKETQRLYITAMEDEEW